MSKILKNQTASPLNIADTGVTIPGSSDYTIPPQDYLLFAASSDTITFIGAGDIVVNDGSSDLTIADGTRLIQGIFPNPVGLIGDTDQTEIGNVGDRLKVNSNLEPIPASNIVYFYSRLLNGSNASMIVNGSSTAQQFSAAPGGSETWYVDQVSLLMEAGDAGIDEFGEDPPLSNGLLLNVQSLGTGYNMANFLINADLGLFFDRTIIPASGSGYYDTDDAAFFTATFKTPIRLNGSQSDFIRFTVRDNMNNQGLDFLRASIRYFRVIS